jgi:hypothetical protein
MFLLTPKAVENLSKATNKALFAVDEKAIKLRRPLGIFFLALTIFLWYIILYK